jgi:hypothetical protein
MTHFAQLDQMKQEMQQCIHDCLDCHNTCLNTVGYHLQLWGHSTEIARIPLLLDCAEICQTSVNFMLRGSALHQRVCQLCAEVCDRCATDCEPFADDVQMQACVEVCRRCAESCRHMAMLAL